MNGGRVMRTRFNKNGTVTISQMPKELYWAVLSIVASSERTFEWNEDEQEWCSNSDFLCSLSKEEKESLDKNRWAL